MIAENKMQEIYETLGVLCFAFFLNGNLQEGHLGFLPIYGFIIC